MFLSKTHSMFALIRNYEVWRECEKKRKREWYAEWKSEDYCTLYRENEKKFHALSSNVREWRDREGEMKF